MRVTPEKVYCSYYGHKYSDIGKEYFAKAFPYFEKRARLSIQMAEAIQAKHGVVLSVRQVAALCNCSTPNFVRIGERTKVLLKLKCYKRKTIFQDGKPAVICFDIEGYKGYEEAKAEYEEFRRKSIEELSKTMKENLSKMFT